MTDRLLIDGTQIIVSKAGHSATNPSLADANKIFDSDWFFGGCILERKAFIFNFIGGTNVYTMNFDRTYNFVPMVIQFRYAPAGAELRDWNFEPGGSTLNAGEAFLGESGGARIFTNRVEQTWPDVPIFEQGGVDKVGWYLLVMAI